jgi:alkyl sulfatase BDS1-like metallo-beta-lactamase superfamily hydrolase
MHVVEGEEGIVVIDPLISAESAAAALALYREHRGERPVTGLIYTHCHIDHFGGAKGVVSAEEVREREVPVLAPAGFLEHAVSENVFAGTAMGRRAAYMYGAKLRRGPDGQIGSGLGQTTSLGTVTLIPPNLEVAATGQEETVDGVRMVFQLTPGTEAPAEMNFHFPEQRVLCVAENATHTMHNVLTLRGAQVRDPHVWAHYLNESIELFGERTDVLFAGHHWPRWGRERIVEYLRRQRDLYAYIHDQTLRLLNRGLTGREIAETLELPPGLAGEWHCRGYYGSVSHNVKAIYQRYMGWYDGNPAHLWQHVPEEAGKRYVAAMGGADAAVAVARKAFDEGDYRWAAEVLNHVLFADSSHAAAKALQADTFERLGFGSENGTWRSAFLAGTTELRGGNFGTPTATASPDMMAALTAEQVFDAIAIRVNGPEAWAETLSIGIELTDAGESYRLDLRNGVLVHHAASTEGADLVLRLPQAALVGLLAGSTQGMAVEGDVAVLGRLVAVLEAPNPDFDIVTP